MGRWTLHLSGWLGLLAVLSTTSYADNVNYCLAAGRSSTCSACIQAGIGCAYCPDETFDGPRCDLIENIKAHQCSAAITAQSSMKIEKNEKINILLQQSQVAPQKMSMSFLPGEERVVDMEVFAPTKGPLDLYILMDFSNSMADDLNNLKRMGKELALLVDKMSDDYAVGFGKFVDKVVEPQTDMRPEKLAQPWPNSDPPFSFKSAIKLTKDVDRFNSLLQKERISGNLDAPEGGFDAILQAAVCGDKIGWRSHATHLLIFSTESAFHYESDGANVLSGILPRNDEQCHLDATDTYTDDTKQDYPSVPTLVRLLGKHNIIPIFAVTNHSLSFYEKLYRYFPIAELGVLQEDSSNILVIMEKAFESIRSKMSIRAEDRPKAINAQFLKTSGEVLEYGDFQIKPGNIGKFKVKLQAQQMVDEEQVCKMDPADRKGVIRVKPTTFGTALHVDAEVLCPTCSCENSPALKAVRCNGNGDLVCGKCQCSDGWLGQYCNCSSSVSTTNMAMCIAPGTAEPCSGRGDCLCGHCVCYSPEQFEGPFCQYDKTQCQRHGGFLCNDRGSCTMGACACTSGWDGPACECPKSNQTCLDSRGSVCNGRGLCVCGDCECQASGLPLTRTCEPNFQAQIGMCEAKRSCVQCQIWKTGEKKDKCGECTFTAVEVDELKEPEKVIESCSYRDEDDDCTYYYTVDYPKDKTDKELEVQVLKKKDCPPAGFLWLIPLIMFLMLLLGLLLLCCWKYCACCKACLALLPCCAGGRMVGFKEDEYLLRQALLTSDHLDTPMERTGPPKGTDVVRWKVTDNVHRGPNHPQAQVQPKPKETIQFPVSLRLNRQFSDNLTHPEARDTEQLRKEVADNLNEVYKQIPGAQKVQKTSFRTQKNAGKRHNHTIVDTVLSAPRASYPDIVKLTEKNVQSGNFHNLKVVPGYYIVATDREATGAVEFQEGVESVDVHVPLFVKDDDDDKKHLQVEALDVPQGIAEIGKRFVKIIIIKDHPKSVFSFLQPAYTYSRQDGVANIPVSREIIEDGRSQVTYRTRDLTAKDKKDYGTVEGDLNYGPGETQKMVPVRLLELGEKDALLDDKQVKQFVMDLSNPRQEAKLGRYPRTTITITDQPDPSVLMFKNPTQNFTTSDLAYAIPVVRTRNQDSAATVRWRTKKAQRFELSGPLKFAPGESEKNIMIDPCASPGQVGVETFQVELFDPSSNAAIGDRRSTLVNVLEGAVSKSPGMMSQQKMGFMNQKSASPGGRLLSPANAKATATGPRNIHLNWDPATGNPMGYKVKYWIYGDTETDGQVVDVKTPQAELTNLYPYCDYEMRVCAYNALGEGNYTDMIPCQTLEDAPGEPGRLAFNVISPTVTQISWAEPAETNGVITAYEVLYTPIDDESKPVGAAKKVLIDSPRKRMILIENLQSKQTYQYMVRAKNSVGWGPFRDATINLAAQPARPLSIPIIPDIPIIDAEAGDEYDSYLMYSSEVLKSPGGSRGGSRSGSKAPSLAGDGGWQHVKLVGSNLDLRKVSWKKKVDHIARLSTDTEASSDEARRNAPAPQPDQFMNGRWDQGFLFAGGSRNMSASSLASSNYRGGSMSTMENTGTYMSPVSGRGSSLSHRQDMMIGGGGGVMEGGMIGGGVHTKEVVMRKRSENRGYLEENIRDSIVMGDLTSKFPDMGGFGYSGATESSSSTTSTYGFSMSQQGSRAARTPASDVNDALQNLDRVLQDTRLTPGVPETPTRLVFSALGPTALKVSWQEPHCEKDILGYSVFYQLLNGGEVKRINVTCPAENSVIVQDLLPNHSYLFKVKGQSQEGWGPEREGVITIESAVDPNSPLSPMPGSPFTLSTPSAPGPLVFTALSPEALQLSWDKPRKPNGDILGYVVTCEQLHGGGEVRSFQVSGDSAETSLTVPDLNENVPYKFKVQARTTQGFGPEREGIITIESQDGGAVSQYSSSSQSMARRDVFQLPTEVTTRTNVSHTMLNDPYFSGDGMMMTTQHTGGDGMMMTTQHTGGGGMMMTTQHTETSGMVTRHITKEVLQRSVVGGTTVTKKVERFYEA